MSKKFSVALVATLALFAILTQAAAAQSTPRPTPTNTSGDTADGDQRGSIQGLVYLDVNGDGVCVNSGVEGEQPIEGIPVEFVSSDEQTVLRLNSGPDGIYGLFAAGQSNWAVSAKPDNRYVVTSEQTIFVPVYPDQSLNATEINFCVQERRPNGVSVLVSIPLVMN